MNGMLFLTTPSLFRGSNSLIAPLPCLHFLPVLPATQWLHSLHPDVFVNIEYNAEAGGPFLVPRVKEAFDYYSAQRAYHDTMFAPCQEDNSAATISKLLHWADEHGSRQHEEKKSVHAASYITSPQAVENSAVQSFERVTHPTFRRPLDRSLTFTVELFTGTRGCLNVVAVEGPQRFIRPWSHQRWVRELRRHGFATPPWAHAVVSQVCRLMESVLPDAVRVTKTDDGLAIAFCGRDTIHATLWSVDEAHTGLSLGLSL